MWLLRYLCERNGNKLTVVKLSDNIQVVSTCYCSLTIQFWLIKIWFVNHSCLSCLSAALPRSIALWYTTLQVRSGEGPAISSVPPLSPPLPEHRELRSAVTRILKQYRKIATIVLIVELHFVVPHATYSEVYHQIIVLVKYQDRISYLQWVSMHSIIHTDPLYVLSLTWQCYLMIALHY